MVPELGDDGGIENTHRSRDNMYEYRDKPIRPNTLSLSRPSSQASSGSAMSLKEGNYVSSSPNPHRNTPPPKPRARQPIKTQLVQGVPQTQVWKKPELTKADNILILHKLCVSVVAGSQQGISFQVLKLTRVLLYVNFYNAIYSIMYYFIETSWITNRQRKNNTA